MESKAVVAAGGKTLAACAGWGRARRGRGEWPWRQWREAAGVAGGTGWVCGVRRTVVVAVRTCSRGDSGGDGHG